MTAAPTLSSLGSSREVTRGALVVVALACLAAWVQRWLQDDAYITFRYAQLMAEGLGPVWNPGEAIEGYSNFSWMLLLAGCERLGVPMGVASQLLGIACYAWSLASIYRMGLVVLPSPVWALFALVACATNYSFAMYATGGLETALVAALTLAALANVASVLRGGPLTLARAAALSTVLGLALLTRPDTPLLAGVTGSVCAVFAWRGPRRWSTLAALVLPGVLLVAPWLAWKLSFYGSILPNTFHAKAGGRGSLTWLRGLIYVAWPWISYWWLPACVVIALKAGRRLAVVDGVVWLLFGYFLLWTSYVAFVGGDVMEFRMLVPVLPLGILLMMWAASRAFATWRAALVLTLVCTFGSVSHAQFFPRYVKPPGIGTIGGLASSVDEATPSSWASIGRKLGRDLSSWETTIAVSPAGAIPYFSRQRTIDVLGLNDAWVSRHGVVRKKCTVCQSHSRLATIRYLLDREVNLMFAHPLVVTPESPKRSQQSVVAEMFYWEDLDLENLPESTQLVHIPLGDDVEVLALYLVPTESVDRLLHNGVWQAEPFVLQHEVGQGLTRAAPAP